MSTLYLLRHAAAEDSQGGQLDADRALTAEGVRKFRRAARGIVELLRESPPPLILTSPLLRARQTAELLVEAFDGAKLKTELRLVPALAPPGNLTAVLRQARAQDTMAVAHEPFLSAWIGQLCFRSAGDVELKKGALAAVALKTGERGQLLFLVQPGILRLL